MSINISFCSFNNFRKYRTKIEHFFESLIDDESRKRHDIQQKLDLKVRYITLAIEMTSEEEIGCVFYEIL